MAFKPDHIIGNIKDKLDQIHELEILVPKSRTPQEKASRVRQIEVTKKAIQDLRRDWATKNKGKRCPV